MDEQNNNPALLEFGPNEDIIFTESNNNYFIFKF